LQSGCKYGRPESSAGAANSQSAPKERVQGNQTTTVVLALPKVQHARAEQACDIPTSLS
jgi:hypothetical protein